MACDPGPPLRTGGGQLPRHEERPDEQFASAGDERRVTSRALSAGLVPKLARRGSQVVFDAEADVGAHLAQDVGVRGAQRQERLVDEEAGTAVVIPE